ncbi:MAG: hypothetical protein IAE67_01615 [Candidatus Competibacteraceae bacterium]|nr:hypothetical protein [Candidatus Competibacteraceae bacterium]
MEELHVGYYVFRAKMIEDDRMANLNTQFKDCTTQEVLMDVNMSSLLKKKNYIYTTFKQ